MRIKKSKMDAINPNITAKGFRTAVKDYTESSVIEELAANSFDEDSSTVLVLLDMQNSFLYIIDDGKGFNKASIKEVTTLGGGGDKASRPYATGHRIYLGSYGYGLKSCLNISIKTEITSASKEDGVIYNTVIDWSIFDEAFKPTFEGYACTDTPKVRNVGNGTIIKLSLKNPTTKTHLDEYGKVLSNLPNDAGNFKCYYGFYEAAAKEVTAFSKTFKDLSALTNKLYEAKKINLASDSLDSELEDCETTELTDKETSVVGKFYFAGMQGDKVQSLKEVLRGIYVRVHGRLLKHNFSEDEFTYGISKYSMFKHGLRIELSVDWLRDQITLSRDGIKFSNEKLKKDFKSTIQRLVYRFTQPKLEKIKKGRTKIIDAKLKQRLELASKRAKNSDGVIIKGITGGFVFKPETDAELAILLAQSDIMQKIDKGFKLIDYNDQAPFDCIIWDATKRDFIYAELEPTITEFLQHRTKTHVQLVITWTLTKWRLGAKRSGIGGWFALEQHSNKKKGNYRLLEYPNEKSVKPRRDYNVIAIDELL